MQAALPCLLYAVPDVPSAEPGVSSVLELRGGTDAPMAPSIGYLQHVLLPMLRRLFGLTLALQVGFVGWRYSGRAFCSPVLLLAAFKEVPGTTPL